MRLTVAMVVFTSKSWQRGDASAASGTPASSLVRWLAVATCVLVYLQLVFGAVLRHVPVDSEPGAFMLAVRFHLFLAGVLTLARGVAEWDGDWEFSRRAAALPAGPRAVWIDSGAATVGRRDVDRQVCRAGLGGAWLPFSPFAIQADGWLQTNVITAHVAVGSLLLGTSAALALMAWRSLSADSISMTPISSRNVGLAT